MAAPPSHSAPRRVACVLGVPIDIVDMDETVRRVREAAKVRTPLLLSTPNLNWAMMAQADEAFRNAVIDSDLCIADGMPLVWVARLLGVTLPGRVAGSALLEQIRNGPADEPIKVYFFGGEDGAAEAAAKKLAERPCGLRCVGWESPGFGSVEALSRPESLARIRASGADFLVVSLGAKKGQAWIIRNREQLGVPVVSHLGAALNFIAGTVTRAPQWMQRSGLEWLWRIKEEPKLWKRYLSDGVAFLRVLVRDILPLAFTVRVHGRESTRHALTIRESAEEAHVDVRVGDGDADVEAVRESLAAQCRPGGSLCVTLHGPSTPSMELVGALQVLVATCARRSTSVAVHARSAAAEAALRRSRIALPGADNCSSDKVRSVPYSA